MKLKIHHVRGCFGSAVVHLCLAGKPAVSEIKGFSMLSGHLLYITNDCIHKKLFMVVFSKLNRIE